MKSDGIAGGAKVALYILLLFFLADSLALLFFHGMIETFYSAKLLDPDITRLFGAHFLGTAAILGFALNDGSVAVVRPVVKGLIVMELLSLAIAIYSYMYSGLYGGAVYASLTVTILVFLALLVYAMKMIKE